MSAGSRFHLRPMVEGDLDAVNAIYNHYVLHSTCTYQLEPETDEGRAAWFQEHGDAHPLLVAEQDGRVVGWGSLSRYQSRCGYASRRSLISCAAASSPYIIISTHRWIT